MVLFEEMRGFHPCSVTGHSFEAGDDATVLPWKLGDYVERKGDRWSFHPGA
jgi:hypothetical protein